MDESRIIHRMATRGLYEPDQEDTKHRELIALEYQSRRAMLQVQAIQHLDYKDAAVLQVLFLQVEAALYSERNDLNASWAMTVYRAQDAGLLEGRENGYAEAVEQQRREQEEPAVALEQEADDTPIVH